MGAKRACQFSAGWNRTRTRWMAQLRPLAPVLPLLPHPLSIHIIELELHHIYRAHLSLFFPCVHLAPVIPLFMYCMRTDFEGRPKHQCTRRYCCKTKYVPGLRPSIKTPLLLYNIYYWILHIFLRNEYMQCNPKAMYVRQLLSIP